MTNKTQAAIQNEALAAADELHELLGTGAVQLLSRFSDETHFATTVRGTEVRFQVYAQADSQDFRKLTDRIVCSVEGAPGVFVYGAHGWNHNRISQKVILQAEKNAERARYVDAAILGKAG